MTDPKLPTIEEFLRNDSRNLRWSPDKGWHKEDTNYIDKIVPSDPTVKLPEYLNPAADLAEEERIKLEAGKKEYAEKQRENSKIVLAKIVNDHSVDKINKELLLIRVGIEEVLSEINENPTDVSISDIVSGLEKLLVGSFRAGERILMTRSNAMETLMSL